MNCEHCSCYTVKDNKCCYCHEGNNDNRRLDEYMKKSIIKLKDKKEKQSG